MILQLNPTLPLDTPKGPAHAHLVIDYGQEHYTLFVCFVDATGECWVFPNSEVKLRKNVTMGVRTAPPEASCTCKTDALRDGAGRLPD